MPDGRVAEPGTVTVIPVRGLPEVREGDDLARVIVRGVRLSAAALRDGDVVVVSSKVVSKALGLWAPAADREPLVMQESRRVVAERATPRGITRITHTHAGPVMAGSGIDASNVGERGDEVLLLPRRVDDLAAQMAHALHALTSARVGVIITDTAGRPWRRGQVDLALGCAGLPAITDHRGGTDADGRPLAVTEQAVADEVASAADLVKGKNRRVPVALVRGLAAPGLDVAQLNAAGSDQAAPDAGEPTAAAGAASLVRAEQDWFALGQAEAVRAALGVAPGSPDAAEVGVPAVPTQSISERLERAVRVALHGEAGGATARVDGATATLTGPPYALGRAAARLEAALTSEGLQAQVDASADAVTVTAREEA